MFSSDYCQIEYNAELDAVFCKWKQYCEKDDYRKPLLFGLEILKKKHCKNWIIDTTNGFNNHEEDSVWLLTVFIPKAIYSSCKNIFFLTNENSTIIDEIKSQERALSQFFNVSICNYFNELQMKILKVK